MERMRVKNSKISNLYDSPNIIAMPLGGGSALEEFIRCHVLIRVWDGDADAWLAHLDARESDDADVRFARTMRMRMRRDPSLLASLRAMVDATPFWCSVSRAT